MRKIKRFIIPACRAILLTLGCVGMVLSAVFGCLALDKKGDLIQELYDRNYLVEIPGYPHNQKLTYYSSDMGTLISMVNYDVAAKLGQVYNHPDIFREEYQALMKDQSAVEELLGESVSNYGLRRFMSRFDSDSVYYMNMAEFCSDRVMTDPYYSAEVSYYYVEELDSVTQQPTMVRKSYSDEELAAKYGTDLPTALEITNGYDLEFVRYMGYLLICLLFTLLVFTLFTGKKKFNEFVPKGEKSTIGLPAYLANLLCYLTLGILGVVLFFFEKKSRYIKQAAVQSMMIGIVCVIFVGATSLMYTIFSYMFPPVQNIAQTLRCSVASVIIGSYIYGFVMALINRACILPIIGDLSVRSSYID